MERMIRCCFLLIFFIAKQVITSCRQEAYPNLCVFDGNQQNITETRNEQNLTEIGNEQNITETENDQVEFICDCEKVIFCSIIKLSEECESTVIKLAINANTTINSLHCRLRSLDSEAVETALEILNVTGNELSVNISTDGHLGSFQVFCNEVEIVNEFNETLSIDWDIAKVTPNEVLVDSEILLQLTLNETNEINSTIPWCFIKTPDNETEILSAVWNSQTQISCQRFSPAIPGIFTVSLSSDMTSGSFEKGINVRVTAKQPIAQSAKYSSDFNIIFIYFDVNVKLYSDCEAVFSEVSRKSFGTGFNCFTKGNALLVQMGSQFEIISNITISSSNKICQDGSQNPDSCSPAVPANLNITKPKILGPSLSLLCQCAKSGSQKSMKVVVNNPKKEDLKEKQVPRFETTGKTQRRNVMMWRAIRQFQSKLSKDLVDLQINKTDIRPFFENLSSLDHDLDVDGNLCSQASVSISAQSSPDSSSVLAEADVAFCNESVTSFRYDWLVDDRHVLEGGKIFTANDLSPGKHVIKCVIHAHDSGEILGQGWATAEVPENTETIFIVPSEVVAGTTSDVNLQAITQHTDTLTWSCRTDSGELCHTIDNNSVENVVDFHSHNLTIPAGTLPIGNYVWTVESAGKSDSSKVFIKSESSTSIDVEILPAFVNPSQEVVLRANLGGEPKIGCSAWWSSVRQNGFDYIKTNEVVSREILIQELEKEVSLVIPPPSNTSKGLEAGSLYLFKIQVFCPRSGSLNYAKVPVHVGDSLKSSSPLIVEPLNGKAMNTLFEVSGGELDVSEEDHPVLYEWSYIDECNVKVPIKRGLSPEKFQTYLPPGDIRVIVQICDGKNICSTTTSSTISVIQAAEVQEKNYHEVEDQIRRLTTSGNTFEGFGLALTAFKSLALTAETEIRDKIRSAVEEGIRSRIKELIENPNADSKVARLSLEFCEEASKVAKYFHKGSDVLKLLTDFRDRISNKMRKI